MNSVSCHCRPWVGKRQVSGKAAGAAIASRIPAVAFLRSGGPDPDQAYTSGFRPLPPLGKTEGDAFTFIKAREPGWCEIRDVDEYILSASSASNEADAVVDIEPISRCRSL
jgi:hypothetical protein